MEKFIEFLKLLKFLLPIIIIVMVIYTFYLKFTQNRVTQTQEDIIFITNMIRDRHMSTNYTNFTADYIAYSNYLPVDMKTKQVNGQYEIISRFGGKINFMESPKNREEKKDYLYAQSSPQLYKTFYKGLSSYIISFTNLHRRECIWLSQVKWEESLPNFMALEASYITGQQPYNGLDKLHTAAFENEIDQTYSGQDNGMVSNRHLTSSEASRACLCVLDNCTFALKLY